MLSKSSTRYYMRYESRGKYGIYESQGVGYDKILQTYISPKEMKLFTDFSLLAVSTRARKSFERFHYITKTKEFSLFINDIIEKKLLLEKLEYLQKS